MPFRSYHRFQNRTTIEHLVSTLRNTNNITDQSFAGFHRYHPAMLHKLKSAKYNLERLTDKLTTTNVQEAADPTSDFMFEVNMFIDGFFYNAGSSLDILARVVLALFGEPLTGNIYFQTAHERLALARLGDPILPRLASPRWRDEFSNYRNTSTHELILASMFRIEIDATGPEHITRVVFPLPDDPRAEPAARRYRHNPNVVDYLRNHFTRVLRLANTVYGDIVQRTRVSGSLPL